MLDINPLSVYWRICSPTLRVVFVLCCWPLLCKTFLFWRSPIYLFLLLFPLLQEIYQKQILLREMSEILLPMFSPMSFMVLSLTLKSFFLIYKDFICLVSERGEGRKKEKERNINMWLLLTCPLQGTWPTIQAALTGNRTSDLSTHRPALEPLSHSSQG